ncbi:MAG: helix-turn-helix transcriptional regulator [Oscillospiraceae bacterium]|nr:helix-turn-helix transcriptional regulator [Oscillospiraceae bacterium]
MYIYQRIRDLREDKDLRQEDVAPILQTTREQYSRWERGAQEIPFHHAITLARYYRVSLDYIAGLTNKKQGR